MRAYLLSHVIGDIPSYCMKIKTRWLVAGVALIILLGGGGYFVHQQRTHFNKNIQINGVNVGGLTAKEAQEKLAATKLEKKVYLDDKLLYTAEPSTFEFTSKDLSKFEATLRRQATAFSSDKATNYTLTPTAVNGKEVASLSTSVKEKLEEADQTRTAPVDAYAILENNKVSVIKEKNGNKYDISAILKELKQNERKKDIYLTAKYLQPLKSNSSQVKEQVQKLKALTSQKITYTVQKTNYELTTSDILTSARYQNGSYQFDTQALKQKIADINQKQATLNKTFAFKTAEGNEIQVPDGTYGWALSETKAEKTLVKALEDRQTRVDAKADIYGKGYDTRGTGYDITENNGLGNTYVEVSIEKQHLWAYKNGQQVASIDVVTGTQSTNNDTPKGVYYVMYKQTDTTLRGSRADGSAYASPVKYWAPFTLDGCGFHDADWRTNWSKTAYQKEGSLGCVNMKPSEAKNVFDNLSQSEPVIIY